MIFKQNLCFCTAKLNLCSVVIFIACIYKKGGVMPPPLVFQKIIIFRLSHLLTNNHRLAILLNHYRSLSRANAARAYFCSVIRACFIRCACECPWFIDRAICCVLIHNFYRRSNRIFLSRTAASRHSSRTRTTVNNRCWCRSRFYQRITAAFTAAHIIGASCQTGSQNQDR